jgi:hypothetical protein
MEKNGAVQPGKTPDTEQRLPAGQKTAAANKTQQTKTLDDDARKRLSDAVAEKLR